MRGIEGRDASAPFAHRNAVDCCGREEDRLPHIQAKPKCLDELGTRIDDGCLEQLPNSPTMASVKPNNVWLQAVVCVGFFVLAVYTFGVSTGAIPR